jgi:ribulose-5-phosphate 4-epimerase/fuculose-1-phosphate aldolase
VYSDKATDLLRSIFPDCDDLFRMELAAAYQLNALFGFDDLCWNHISARNNGSSFLITPGTSMFEHIQPDDLVDNKETENVTGDVIHGGIYESRPDVHAIVHTHTLATTAVACLPGGFEFLTQDSAQFVDSIGYHEWEGISTDFDECQRIAAALGPTNNILIMKNHGVVVVGKTIAEAWVRHYYFDVCCRIQLKLLATGQPANQPDPAALAHCAQQMDAYLPGEFEWEPLLQRLKTKGAGWGGRGD